MRHTALLVLACLPVATSVLAQNVAVPASVPAIDLAVPRSMPTALPVLQTTPEARDVAWAGGTMRLEVDATDVQRRIIRVKQTIPVAGTGPLTLLFPEWLPGKHAPRGEIEKLAGLAFTADDKPISWERDPLNVYAFHVSVPAGTKTLVATFQFLAPSTANQGRIIMTDSLLNLQWNSVSLYPAGYYTRRIPVQASVTLPDAWTAATALRGTKTGNAILYAATDYETLVDSPIFAGRYARSVDLGHDVALNMFADDPAELLATPEQIGLHRKLVDEAVALFGARHFDHYDFLLSISDTLGGIGLEHHRESENGTSPGYFTRWSASVNARSLLPHEFTHSWNGKFRRPELLWTPDFSTPMQDELLWVYEGQTQFWGQILAARSGLQSKAEALETLAATAARLDNVKGRQWRVLEDTTLDPIIAARRPKPWASWQRTEDYYQEGLMIWLEADAIMRRESNGTKGLDDFAKAFFGMKDGDWGVLTYNRQEVIDTLNSIVPWDWSGFLRDRVDKPTKEVTKGGLAIGGYRLVFNDTPNISILAGETAGKMVDQSFGVGLTVANDGSVAAVIWESPAFKAGVTTGMTIVAINGVEYSAEQFRTALRENAERKQALNLIVKQDKRYRTITLDYSGGLRYPHLEKIGEGESSLDRLLQARTGATSVN